MYRFIPPFVRSDTIRCKCSCLRASLFTVLSVLPGVTIYDASKEHVHGKFHILSLESKFLETYLALEMSLNNA